MIRRVKFIVVPVIVVVAALATVTPGSADFVCPVLPVSQTAVDNSEAGFITIYGGDTSILPGAAGDPADSPVDVPDGATNDDGAGSPGGAHAVPGDPGYTAIWN